MSMRRNKGSSIAETAASLVLLLPILVVVLFVVLEASQAYFIKQSLAQAAREASRDLSVIYGQQPSIANNRPMEDLQVFDTIRLNNVINASAQFDDPVWNNTAVPPTVEVTVHYTSGQNSLPVFPNPDPLNLGSQFQLSATSTYRLE